MLAMHKMVSAELFKLLAQCKGRDLEFSILDTDTPPQGKPFEIMKGSVAEGVVEVFSRKRAAEFCGKRYLNVNAKNAEEVFPDGIVVQSNDYLDELQAAGIRVNYQEQSRAEDQCPDLDSPAKKIFLNKKSGN